MLRRAALGEALPFEARSGMALFLHCGMWGWARTICDANTGMGWIQPPSPDTTSIRYEPKGVIRLFAAIVTNNDSRRAS